MKKIWFILQVLSPSLLSELQMIINKVRFEKWGLDVMDFFKTSSCQAILESTSFYQVDGLVRGSHVKDS